MGCCKTQRETCSSIVQMFSCVLITIYPWKTQGVSNQPKNFRFCTVLPPIKRVYFFQLFSQSYGYDRNFLYKNFISNVFRFRSMAFCIKTTIFLAMWKTDFPKKYITMMSQVCATYLKKCVAVFRIRRCLHWLFSTLCSRVMTNNNLKRHDRGFCVPKGFT